MIEPVVMAPGPASSHIGRCPCGDSWIHLYVVSLKPLGCSESGVTLAWSWQTPSVGLGSCGWVMTCRLWMSLPAFWTPTHPSDTPWRIDSGKSHRWFSTGLLPVPLLGGFPPLCNVINRAWVRYTGRLLSICGFCIKTNIVNTYLCIWRYPSRPPPMNWGWIDVVAGSQQCCCQAWDRQLVGILP